MCVFSVVNTCDKFLWFLFPVSQISHAAILVPELKQNTILGLGGFKHSSLLACKLLRVTITLCCFIPLKMYVCVYIYIYIYMCYNILTNQ